MNAPVFSENTIIEQFRAEMAARGVPFSGTIKADANKITRYTIDGDRKHALTGWYILHTDGIPAGEFGCWKRGVQATWCAKSENTLTEADCVQLAKRREENERRRREEQEQIRAEAAANAEAIWNAAQPCDTHPYLTRKGVPSHGLRVGRWTRTNTETGEVWLDIPDALLIPIRQGKKLVSLQAIFPDKDNPSKRDKDFLSGGQKRGCMFAIGKPNPEHQVIVICEGYSTGASIHAATGHAVVIAFDAGNIQSVAEKMRSIYPKAEIIIAADNDRWTIKPIENPGLSYAKEAAAAVRGRVAVPEFDDLEGRPTDFNDLHQQSGLEAVAAIINGEASEITDEPATIPGTVGHQVKSSPTPMDAGTVDVYSPLFDTNTKGKPLATIENMREILRRINTTVRYNVISKQVEILIPGASFSVDNMANASMANIISWTNRFQMATGSVGEYILALADTNPYNPVANWILSREWDGIGRFRDLCETIREARPHILPDGRNMRDVVLMRWMISAVAAAFEPNGIVARGVLVLQGPQNIGKTHWLKKLAPKELDVIKDGITLNPSDKDSVMLCVSNWIVELGELDATFRKADIASLKSFLTLDRDKLRRPYDRTTSEFARRTVFFASVNPRQFLHDATGNSRFWTVECESINHNHNLDMQQVWAEIYHLYRQGVGWYLDADEFAALNDHNEDYTSSDPVHDLIDSMYDWQSDPVNWVFRMNATEICITAGIQRPTKADTNSASSYVVSKYKVKTLKVKGYKQWLMPPKLFKYDNAPPDPAHPGYHDY